jgi:hypothetical protein
MDLPELPPQKVRYHGKELHEYVAPGRYVIEIPGRTYAYASPEECENYSMFGEILDDGRVICPDCGLDAT